jgi:hypothetical protein
MRMSVVKYLLTKHERQADWIIDLGPDSAGNKAGLHVCFLFFRSVSRLSSLLPREGGRLKEKLHKEKNSLSR